MRVAEAVAELGIDDSETGELIFARKTSEGMAHYTLSQIGDKTIPADLYIASARFKRGTVDKFKGRVEQNIDQILWLSFDFDCCDFSGIPKEQLWEMSDAALWPWIEALRERIEVIFGHLGLPIHRLDYTGYGLSAHLNLPPHKPDAVTRIRELHKAIVQQINLVAREPLADKQVSDSGTRIMRFVPTTNTKGKIVRQTKNIYRRDGVVTEAQLIVAAGEIKPPPTRAVPVKGETLDGPTCEQIVAAVRPSWQPGARHGIALALAALLAKAGVPEEQCNWIIHQLAAGDDEEEDRFKAVHTSYERVRSGLPTRGFFGLQDALPQSVVEWLDALATRLREASAPRITIGGKPIGEAFEQARKEEPRKQEKRLEFFEPPDSAFHGWIGDYAELMTPTTEAPRGYHLGVGLTFVGAIIGRHISAKYGSDPLYPNLYTLLVGRSGRSRKDTAIKRATRLLTDPALSGTRVINHGISIATDVGSSTALLSHLSDKPNTLLYITEFAKLMGNARRKGSESIIPTLIEAFDTPPVMHNLSMANRIEARYPYLSMLAATQPDILSGLMSDEDMHSGFANRFLFICGEATCAIPDPPPVDRVRANALLFDLWDRRADYTEGQQVPISPDAEAYWRDWYVRDWNTPSMSHEEDAMRVRHAVLIVKIALIYTFCDGAKSISREHLERATQYVEWMWRHVQTLLGTWGRTIEGQIEELIRTVLERDGAMPKRELQMKTKRRKWAATEFSKVFDAMVKNQTIITDPTGMVGLVGEQ